ncbi:MAG: hypothetical protein Q9214_003401 [Letrouitia sp. 1 TL-2023]
MLSFLSRFSPTPAFPAYSGPYEVGTIEVETPASELQESSPAPDPSISTVSFRIFYPCQPTTTRSNPVFWLPCPQHEYLGAYFQFLGVSQRLAVLFRNLPFVRLLYFITIPAIDNAKLLPPPTKTKRWPVMVFSHGLGGSKNAYSHLLGSLASHGMVVVAPDHRDGSAPISFVVNELGGNGSPVAYRSISHKQSPEVWKERDAQLKIRLWELGLAYEALLKIDRGEPLANFSAECTQESEQRLLDFQSSLDVHTPGSVSWSGHSFGAAAIVQLVKSVFYRPPNFSPPPLYKPLYEPSPSSSIVQQITPSSPLSLLDLWSLPLLSDSTTWLRRQPLPCSSTPSGPSGANLLAILSEAFYKWSANLHYIKLTVSSDPALEHPLDSSRSSTQPPPYVFYPVSSAHLSQSDFGILFPWLTKKAFKAEDPARTLRLNTRAILEVLRRNGVEVADTSSKDMEEEGVSVGNGGSAKGDQGSGQDTNILRKDGCVKGWIALELDQNNGDDEAVNKRTDRAAEPIEAIVEGEIKKGD